MACNHDRIRCTNGVFFCDICGAELPAGVQTGKPAPAQEAPGNGQETPKKTTRKKGVK